MTEPSSNIPGEIADEGVERQDQEQEPADAGPDRVELQLDEDKLEAWEAVASDYEIEPGGRPVPNSMDTTDLSSGRPEAETDDPPQGAGDVDGAGAGETDD